MSKIAAHCPKAADDRMVHRRLRPLPALAGALVLAAGLPLISPEAAAQSRSGIVINNDVLNSLGPGPEAAPLAPLAPPAPPALSPIGQPGLQAPPGGGGGDGGFQPYGDGSYVVTRPGTLLFPPPQAPDSTLTPGFAGAVDNEAARARALDNAFAEGPEPSSQLLIPLDRAPEPDAGSGDSVIVFMDNLPAADPDADRSAAPVLVLQAPPQPARPKPAVPPTALAAVEPPTIVETVALAPEFATPQLQDEPRAAEPETLAPEAEADVDETPPPTLAEVPAAAAPDSATTAPVATETSEAMASAPDAAATDAAAPDTGNGPVSLLPEPPAQTASRAPARAESLVPAEPRPSGLQTASLTVGDIEDRSFLFEVDSAELSPEVELELRALAEALHDAGAGDIQVLGFASGQDDTDDQARKLALSRALKVRSFLIDAGIASTRIQVRSLGDRADGGPANRVDIKPIGS